ncbi:Inner membrane protein YqaA [compost metagenome]
MLVGLLINNPSAVAWLLLIATTGNVLGSIVNWLLGRSIEHLRERRWFPMSPQQLDKAQRSYQRYGHWSLLLSWVPIIGDPLTLIAGVMREPFWRFVLIVGLAKGARYAVLALLTLHWSAA